MPHPAGRRRPTALSGVALLAVVLAGCAGNGVGSVDLLGPGASVTWRDSSGKDRAVIVPSDWQVCTQNPVAGAAYHGVKVTLGAVKFGEHC